MSPTRYGHIGPVAICCFCTLMVLPELAVPSALTAAEDQDALKFLLRGLKNEREKLRSGVFRVRGTKHVATNIDGEKALDGDVSMLVAFDYDAARLRFDRTEPFREPWTEKTFGMPRRAKVLTITYCRTQDFVAIADPRRGVKLDLWPSDHELRSSQKDVVFDVRSLGIGYWRHFTGGSDFRSVYADAERLLNREIKVTQESPGRYRVGRQNGDMSRVTLWIDEGHGFSPLRNVLEMKKVPKASEPWPVDPVFVSEVSWKCMSGVWVPVTLDIESRDSIINVGKRISKEGEADQSYTLTFDWEAVNKPVPDKYFQYEDMPVEKGRPILDHRAGKPVVLGSFGMSFCTTNSAR